MDLFGLPVNTTAVSHNAHHQYENDRLTTKPSRAVPKVIKPTEGLKLARSVAREALEGGPKGQKTHRGIETIKH